ncbi:MAG: pyruvate formate-lyase-activating protein [Candidatus Gracilibacteria bacterium]
MHPKFCKVLSPSELKKVKPVNKSTGMIHSFETFGALDGPGIRFVVFFEGCPLRCVYCHNRDMLDLKDYMTMTAHELLDKVLDYKPYFGAGGLKGGVTISGGDPIFQPQFLFEFLKLCKKAGIHTTIDTSLFTNRQTIDSIFPYVDLFMVSLKHFDSKIHRCLTGVPNEGILNNIKYLSGKIEKAGAAGGAANRPKLWFRYVVLPGYTDTKENLKALVKFLRGVVFEQIELLPYHTFGVYKWKKLGLPYVLEGVKPPSMAVVRKIKKMLEREKFKVLLNE